MPTDFQLYRKMKLNFYLRFSFFFAVKKTKLDFHFVFRFSPPGDHRVDSDRKCKLHRFCPARSDCYNIAHGILSCYTDKIWKLQLKYFSYKRDQRRAFSSNFNLHIKIHQERILKMQALIGLKKHISVKFIHQ